MTKIIRSQILIYCRINMITECPEALKTLRGKKYYVYLSDVRSVCIRCVACKHAGSIRHTELSGHRIGIGIKEDHRLV